MSDTKMGLSPEEKKDLQEALNIAYEPFKKWKEEKEIADAKNQLAIDELLSKMKGGEFGSENKLNFGDAFKKEVKEQFESKQSDFERFQTDRGAKLKLNLKTVGNMTVSGNLTGDSVASYRPGGPIVNPSQRVNFRELIHTVPSPTGTYVSYKETGSEGSIDLQTEGSAKSQIDYDLTEVKTVSGYIAGYVRFSKQMMKHLPFLQNTLPRLLLRDFYKKENRHFYDLFATQANGFNTTSETDDAKQLLDVLMGRLDADFNNSFILCRHTAVGRILKLLYNNGNYFGAGSVVGTQAGQLTIAGCPVVGVTFIPSYDKVMVIDNDYVERVETESLSIEFSYDDSDNFQKNLVTARIECFENLNILRSDAHSLIDMGNSSSS